VVVEHFKISVYFSAKLYTWQGLLSVPITIRLVLLADGDSTGALGDFVRFDTGVVSTVAYKRGT